MDLAQVLSTTRAELVRLGESEGLDASGWFDRNGEAIQIFSELIVQIASEQSRGEPALMASRAFTQLVDALRAEDHPKLAWVTDYRDLLEFVAERTVQATSAEAAPAVAVLASDEKPARNVELLDVDTSEEDRRVEQIEALATSRPSEVGAAVSALLARWGFSDASVDYQNATDAASELRQLLEVARRRARDSRLGVARQLLGFMAAVDGLSWATVTAQGLFDQLRSSKLAQAAALLLAQRERRHDLTVSVEDRLRSLGTLLLSMEQVRLPDESVLPIDSVPSEDAKLLRAQHAAAGLRVGFVSEPVILEPGVAPDLRTPGERTRANIEAIQILARGARSHLPEEIAKLRLYTGLGGLSRKSFEGKVPPDFLPEERGQIHEYYTSTLVALAIAHALQKYLPGLVGDTGKINALEPSAGIGRMVNALSGDGFDTIRWTAVEYSRISARLLSAIRPDITLFNGPFEQWISDNPGAQGSIDLVVSNPPYGQRGAAAHLDRNRAYRERQYYLYFLLRTSDLIRPDGIGVYLIPGGFMTARVLGITRRESASCRDIT